MKRNLLKKIYATFLAALVCLPIFGQAVLPVSANESALDSVSASGDASALQTYDDTSISNDLKTLLNPILFPKNPLGHHQVIQFSEYCYSAYPLYSEYYGLYVYIYNPTEVPIYEYGNVLSMATAYGADGKPTKYENIPLTLLDTMAGDYQNRFFKFKVSDSEKFRTLAEEYAKAHNGKRRYDVAGIQLRHTDDSLEMDTAVSKTYYFEGYSKGFSPESETGSTLVCTSDKLDTLDLEVEHTYYRTHDYYCPICDPYGIGSSDGSGIGGGGFGARPEEHTCRKTVCDEINTAYFSVPDEYFEEYGSKLQKIKAEWFEHKTKPIFVTNDDDAYDALYGYIGKDIGGKRYDALPWRILWEETVTQVLDRYTYNYGKTYNGLTDGLERYTPFGTKTTFDWRDADYITQIDWLFKRGETKSKEDWHVTSDEVVRYMEAYTAARPEQGTVKSNGKGNYATGLFTDSIDENRVALLEDKTATSGYVVQEIDAGDTQSLFIEKEQSWWDKFWNGVDYKNQPFSPIVVVDEGIKALSAEQFAKQYYVNGSDAKTVYDYCVKELDAGNHPVLFRFAETDYYASEAGFDLDGDYLVGKGNGYVVQETAFLGFDIISLTFKAENQEETVIPVVSDAIDVINGLDAPPTIDTDRDNFLDTIKELFLYLFALIVVVGIIALVAPLIPWIIKGVVWVITLPFKAIGALFKAIGGAFKKK